MDTVSIPFSLNPSCQVHKSSGLIESILVQGRMGAFDELNITANNLEVEIDFIVTHPYWVYSIDKKNSKLLLDKELNEKIEKLICNSFLPTRKINKILISDISKNLQLSDLTIDKRHLKSNQIKLVEHDKVCGT